MVFVTRYLDLFTTFYSLYNSCMKVLYIATTAAIIYMIRFSEPICSTYDKAQDTFLHWKFAVAPCAAIAFITHLIGSGISRFDLLELLWTFSIYLESIAILPQLIALVQPIRLAIFTLMNDSAKLSDVMAAFVRTSPVSSLRAGLCW